MQAKCRKGGTRNRNNKQNSGFQSRSSKSLPAQREPTFGWENPPKKIMKLKEVLSATTYSILDKAWAWAAWSWWDFHPSRNFQVSFPKMTGSALLLPYNRLPLTHVILPCKEIQTCMEVLAQKLSDPAVLSSRVWSKRQHAFQLYRPGYLRFILELTLHHKKISLSNVSIMGILKVRFHQPGKQQFCFLALECSVPPWNQFKNLNPF